jgi:hypothetical protein
MWLCFQSMVCPLDWRIVFFRSQACRQVLMSAAWPGTCPLLWVTLVEVLKRGVCPWASSGAMVSDHFCSLAAFIHSEHLKCLHRASLSFFVKQRVFLSYSLMVHQEGNSLRLGSVGQPSLGRVHGASTCCSGKWEQKMDQAQPPSRQPPIQEQKASQAVQGPRSREK